MQISYEMVSNAHVHQLIVSLQVCMKSKLIPVPLELSNLNTLQTLARARTQTT